MKLDKIIMLLGLPLLMAFPSCGGDGESSENSETEEEVVPPTPEELAEECTRKFAQAMADGDCETAMEMAIETAKETVQASIDAGCEKYATKIISVKCELDGDIAECTVSEKRAGMEMDFNYDLKLVDDEWKVSSYAKDMGLDESTFGTSTEEDVEAVEEVDIEIE